MREYNYHTRRVRRVEYPLVRFNYFVLPLRILHKNRSIIRAILPVYNLYSYLGARFPLILGYTWESEPIFIADPQHVNIYINNDAPESQTSITSRADCQFFFFSFPFHLVLPAMLRLEYISRRFQFHTGILPCSIFFSFFFRSTYSLELDSSELKTI